MTQTGDNPNGRSEGGALRVSMCVLASGSKGNATVIRVDGPDATRLILIDAGISPLRTRRLLRDAGLSFDNLYDVVLTHFDTDHFQPGWLRALPGHARFHMHARHRHKAQREGVSARRAVYSDAPYTLREGVRIEPFLMSHDELGVAAFRLRFGERAGDLGFATDVGRATDEMIERLRGVDVLAIESNYCPRLQRASARPAFLKRRIMGGHGHLSNEQCAEAVRRIGPRARVVLLHLSQECNRPEIAAAHHAGAPYELIVASQDEPTGWTDIAGEPAEPHPSERDRRTYAGRTAEVVVRGAGRANPSVF